jgi:hypothetical protein
MVALAARPRGYVARRVSRQDVVAVEELLTSASDYTRKVRREINDLRAFMDVNRFPNGTSSTKVLALFAVQYLEGDRRSATTLEGILQDFDRFHVGTRGGDWQSTKQRATREGCRLRRRVCDRELGASEGQQQQRGPVQVLVVRKAARVDP